MSHESFRDVFIDISGKAGDEFVRKSDEFLALKSEISTLKTENETLKARKRASFRSDRIRNQHYIRLAYFDFYSSNRRFPTIKETQELLREKFSLKFSSMAIHRHIREIAKSDVSEMYRVLDPFVYDALFTKIQTTRDPKAIEVWLKYVSGKTEKASLDLNATVDSFTEIKILSESVSKMTDEELERELQKQRTNLQLIKSA